MGKFKVIRKDMVPSIADHVFVQMPDIILTIRLHDLMSYAEIAANAAEGAKRTTVSQRLLKAVGVFKVMLDEISNDYLKAGEGQGQAAEPGTPDHRRGTSGSENSPRTIPNRSTDTSEQQTLLPDDE